MRKDTFEPVGYPSLEVTAVVLWFRLASAARYRGKVSQLATVFSLLHVTTHACQHSGLYTPCTHMHIDHGACNMRKFVGTPLDDQHLQLPLTRVTP